MTHIAIVGAGIAGLTAAYHLRQAADVTLYEKSRGVTGRVATRWYDRPAGRVVVDHGTQVLHDDSPALHDLMHEILPHAALSDIRLPVWTFTADGQIAPGDPARSGHPQWSYATGLATLGKLIVEAGALNVRSQVRIGRLVRREADYQLFDTDGQPVADADQVLIAIPAGQAADLIAASDLPDEERTSLVAALRSATYRRCLSITLGFDRLPTLTPRPYYALINTDRAHPIAWLAFEHLKPGHVPADGRVIVAQMAAGYSTDQWETPTETVIANAADQVSSLLGIDVRQPDWSDLQRWRYSQPDHTLNGATVNGLLPGLWFTGDYLAGGRVHLAAQNGQDIATVIRATV